MPYIGHAPTNAGSFILLDDFDSGFDGNDVTFTLQVGGVDITPTADNLLIILDGVVQHSPEAYTVSGSTLTFTAAPVSGQEFYGMLMGQSASVGEGTVGADELSVTGDGSANQLLSSDADGTMTWKDGSLSTTSATGDLIYRNAGGALARLAVGSTNQVLTVASGLPAWATDVESYLPLSGGTMSGALNMNSQNITNGGAIAGTFTGGLTGNVSGNLTGNVTGNTSGTAATVTTAAQSNITSLGTLTTLTVDNVLVNGTTIGHTSDTDLMTLTSGTLTVAGTIDALKHSASSNAYFEEGTSGNADMMTLYGSSGIKLFTWDSSAWSQKLYIASDGATTFAGNVTGTFVGNITGNVTGNTSGTAATVTGGTQASITSTANLVTVGTIGTGVWQGTAINQTYLVGQSGTNTGDQTLPTRDSLGIDTDDSVTLGSVISADNMTMVGGQLYIGGHSSTDNTFRIQETSGTLSFGSRNSGTWNDTRMTLDTSGNATFAGEVSIANDATVQGTAWNDMFRIGDGTSGKQTVHFSSGSVAFGIEVGNSPRGLISANHDGSTATWGSDFTTNAFTRMVTIANSADATALRINQSDNDGYGINVDCSHGTYVGRGIGMTFARARSDAYYILEAHDSGGTMFSVKGDGTLYADSGATFSGNLSLSEGKSLSHSGGTGDVVSNYFVRVDGNSWADIFQLQINSGSWSSATTQILFANTNINNGMVITTVEGYYSHSGNSSNEYTMGNVTFSENFQWVAVGSSPHRVKLQARSDQNGDSLSMLINIVTTCQAGQSLTITKIA